MSLSLALMLFFVSACQPELKKTTAEEFRRTITGQAQGTTWRITYYDLKERDFTAQVDSLLLRIDESVSTYRKGSVIDRWNKSDTGTVIDDLFLDVLLESWAAYKASDGAFDPTVKPLVSYWGFGPEQYAHPESANFETIDSLLALVDFDTLCLVKDNATISIEELANGAKIPDRFFLRKPIAGMQLDFNAIAQGWSVDVISDFLVANDIKVFFVELGGEIRAGYPKPDGSLWRFGIDSPVAANGETRPLQAIISLRNKGLATSGNYRKFYEKDGVKYAHTIDPATGMPVQHSLLSATVVSDDAASADAMATAFMVMGKDSTINFLEHKAYLGYYVYLIYDDSGMVKTYASPQIEGLIEGVTE